VATNTGTLRSVTAVAHFPASLDERPLERLRRPLQAITAVMLVIDLMILGMHLADSAESPFADDIPTRAKVRVGGQEALVPSSAIPSGDTARQGARVEPVGCLALSSDCYAGPPAPTSPSNGGSAPSDGTTPPGTAPTPVAQADLGVPALGAQASLGLGDGSCTGLGLSALSLGDCPVATGDGPVIVKLGGSLLGD
jgi:hypothetical protein